MRHTIYLLLTSMLILSACAEEEHWDSVTPGHDAGDFSFLLAHEEYAEPRSAESLTGESQPGPASARQTLSNYDRVEFVVVDEAGDKVSGVKGLYDKSTSNMRLEGLHAGAYRILILGMKGDPAADQATIHPINHISEVWLSFPEGLAKPLDGEYFYSATPFTVREVSTASGHEVIAEIPERIVQRRMVGRMDFSFSPVALVRSSISGTVRGCMVRVFPRKVKINRRVIVAGMGLIQTSSVRSSVQKAKPEQSKSSSPIRTRLTAICPFSGSTIRLPGFLFSSQVITTSLSRKRKQRLVISPPLSREKKVTCIGKTLIGYPQASTKRGLLSAYSFPLIFASSGLRGDCFAVMEGGKTRVTGSAPSCGSMKSCPVCAQSVSSVLCKFGLEPVISAETIDFHYGKHLQTYIDNLNRLIEGTPFADSSLDEIVRRADGAVFNNAAQTWNHTFFFLTLTPHQAPMPEKLAVRLSEAFGSVENFLSEFTKAATGLFGSGWAWLAEDKDGRLSIVQTQNAGNPMTSGLTPLMTVDVWEHAYYIDYRNRRADYVAACLRLIDWEKVSGRLK